MVEKEKHEEVFDGEYYKVVNRGSASIDRVSRDLDSLRSRLVKSTIEEMDKPSREKDDEDDDDLLKDKKTGNARRISSNIRLINELSQSQVSAEDIRMNQEAKKQEMRIKEYSIRNNEEDVGSQLANLAKHVDEMKKQYNVSLTGNDGMFLEEEHGEEDGSDTE